MIPKLIHYCWFGGGKKSSKIEKMLKTLDVLKPFGYTVIEWNEENYDVRKNAFLKKAYENKKWAHVSDFARLDILYEYGGIYLDTDVEVIKNFDDLLNYDMFIGFMWDCNLGTAVFGAKKNNPIISDIRSGYYKSDISLSSPNNDMFTRFFIKRFDDFLLNGKEQYLDNKKIIVLNKNKFEHPSFLKKENYTIHHFSQSWKSSNRVKKTLKNIVISMMGLYLYRKYICEKSLKMSPFYEKYLSDK